MNGVFLTCLDKLTRVCVALIRTCCIDNWTGLFTVQSPYQLLLYEMAICGLVKGEFFKVTMATDINMKQWVHHVGH